MIPGVAAHLWQSTLFAGAAWLAVLALRTNRAQVRYWVWFTASAKFLIPFSWLAGLGTLMPHPAAAPTIRAEWVAALQGLEQPLTIRTAGAGAAVTPNHDYAAAAAVALWACGFAAVAICWLLRWRRVQKLRNSARAVSVATGLRIPVPLMSAPDLSEPGVFGVLRPVLLLPEGIGERLSQSQLDAILAHELCHIRRRDNLTAALHMAAQAIFWFHPLTWWIGSRLVEEREQACDEEVLRLGCKPSVYAESILTVCRLYLSSPLECVSGVTGSDLKRRIEAIMRNRSVRGLTIRKKVALAIAGMAALVVPVVMGFLNAPAMRAQDDADWQSEGGRQDGVRGRLRETGLRCVPAAEFPARQQRRVPAGGKPVLSGFSLADIHQLRIQALAQPEPAGSHAGAFTALGRDRQVRHRRARRGHSRQRSDASDDAVSAGGPLQAGRPFRNPDRLRVRHGAGEGRQDGATVASAFRGGALRRDVRGCPTASRWRSISTDLRRLHGDDVSRQAGESRFAEYHYGLAGKRAPRVGSLGASRGGSNRTERTVRLLDRIRAGASRDRPTGTRRLRWKGRHFSTLCASNLA